MKKLENKIQFSFEHLCNVFMVGWELNFTQLKWFYTVLQN
jgi:hypothetical protein